MKITKKEWDAIRKNARKRAKETVEEIMTCHLLIPRSDFDIKLHNRIKAGFIQVELKNQMYDANKIRRGILDHLSPSDFQTYYNGQLVERFSLDLFVDSKLGMAQSLRRAMECSIGGIRK